MSRKELFKSVISQDIDFFDKSSLPGEISSTIIRNIEQIKTGIGFKLADSLALFLRGFACIIFSMSIAWKFAIVFLALIPFMTGCFILMIIFSKYYTNKDNKAYTRAGQISQEVLGSIRTVLSFGLHEKSIELYEKNLIESETMTIRKGLTTGIFFGLSNFLFTSCFGIGVYWAAYLTRTECSQFGVGQVMPAFFSIITSSFTIAQATPFLREFAEARIAAYRLFEILETKSKVNALDETNKSAIKVLNKLNGDVHFKEVCFSYSARADMNILNGLNLNIQAGKTTALVGAR